MLENEGFFVLKNENICEPINNFLITGKKITHCFSKVAIPDRILVHLSYWVRIQVLFDL